MKFLPFFLVSLLHLIGVFLKNETLVFWTKPLLMPLLAFGYWFQAKNTTVRGIVVAALGLSTLGDVSLLFSAQAGGENWFLIGLGFFLLAHFAYIYAFTRLASPSSGFFKKQPVIAIPILMYLAVFVVFLWPRLSPEFLKTPVLIYASVISTMLLMALNTQGVLEKKVAQSLLLGATLFVLSDSAIALHRFAGSFAGADIFIMLTYIFGQYFLVKEL